MFNLKNKGLSPSDYTRIYFWATALLLFPSVWAFSQNTCGCTNCPQYLPDNFQGNFYIQVQNAANPVLGQNGQGVCGVTLHFRHEYVGDLEITLTSPAGQSVTLLGPIGLFGETDATSWDISFVPCGNPADPDAGFSETWNNDQPWGILGTYTGTYYPYLGCLEDFNTGPVNGQWTLSISDGISNDVGHFFDYQIIFCDPSGVSCLSCEANAGNLVQDDQIVCAGDSSALLSLPPTYPPQMPPPPAADYAYAYLIGTEGILTAYDTTPDLRKYPPGTYTVCGISYLKADKGKLPAPNGILTIAQIATALNSSLPPFCGKITPNCVNVEILPLPPNEADTAVICAPQCFDYHGHKFCDSGDYSVVATKDSCPYTATLHLTVLPASYTALYDTVCAGACSQTPDFENACNTGPHVRILPAANGCDSIVTLFLTVLEPLAVLAPPPPMYCKQSPLPLQSTGSTPPGPGVGYAWSSANGGKIDGPADQVSALAATPGDYRLVVCASGAKIVCCDTAYTSVVLDQNPPPAPAAIFGPDQVCPDQAFELKVDSMPGVDWYQWFLPTAAVLDAGQGTPVVRLRLPPGTKANVCVRPENACGPGIPVCRDVSASAYPEAPVPQGPGLVCPGDTLLYTVATDASAGFVYEWNVPSDAANVQEEKKDSLRVVWASDTGGELCLTVSDGCSTSAPACLSVAARPPLGSPFIEGPDSVCAGTAAVYHFVPPAGMAGHSWKITGGSGLVQAGSSKVYVEWGLTAGDFQVCLELWDSCGRQISTCTGVHLLPHPKAYAGADAAVCGTKAGLQAAPGASGIWQFVSGPGPAYFSDSSQSAAYVFASQPGAYLLRWSVGNGLCSVSDSVQIQFYPEPVLSLPSAVCDITNQFYTVEVKISGGTPPYFQDNQTLQGDSFQSIQIPSGASYQFLIRDQNKCAAPVLSGQHTCACASYAGTLSVQPITVCAGESVQVSANSDQHLDGNDTEGYVLYSAGAPGQILAQNSSGVFGFLPGSMSYDATYWVARVVGDAKNGFPDPQDPCYSVSNGQPVRFLKEPFADAGSDAKICGLQGTLDAQEDGLSGKWVLVSGPGNAAFGAETQLHTSVSVTAPGSYIFRRTTTNGFCEREDDVEISFANRPEIENLTENCNGTNTAYRLEFETSKGQPPYFTDGLNGFFDNNIFYSDSILNNNNYFFYVTDANGCRSDTVEGTFYCPCTTFSGSMSMAPLLVCQNQKAVAQWQNNGVKDADDLLRFVLHDQPGSILGTVFSVSNQPEFDYDPLNLKTGETYYISAVAGNGANGQVQLGDPCLSVSPGTPVQWKDLPSAALQGDTALCAGQTLQLVLNGTGEFPLTVTFQADSGNPEQFVLSGPGPLLIPVFPLKTTTYSLLSVAASACIAPLNEALTVHVGQPPEAGNALSPASACTGAADVVILSSLLSGANPGGTWTDQSSPPVPADAFEESKGLFYAQYAAPGIYFFKYQLAETAFCPGDSATVAVEIHPNPEANAGPDRELDCHTTEATLGAGLPEPGVFYSWWKDGSPLAGADSSRTEISQPGTYVLRVENTFGCVATDSVEVRQPVPALAVSGVRIRDVRCLGEANGAIFIDSVQGGTAPFRYALNEGPYGVRNYFTNLKSGTYTASVLDAAGCEWHSGDLPVWEPPALSVNLGPDIEAAFGDSLYLWVEIDLPDTAIDTIIWAPLLDTAFAGKRFQKWLPLHSGKVSVIVTDSQGCRGSDEMVLTINRKRGIYIPNAIDPNNPNNNVFVIFAASHVAEVVSLNIFDRWGNQVFENRHFQPNDPDGGWRGTYKGQACAAGVYLVSGILRLVDGTDEEFTGTVTLFR